MEVPVVAVAYSGGRDSTALLHACCEQARAAGWRVLALHVHHGLSDHADRWLAHAEAQCRRWAEAGVPVEFMAQRLSGRPASRQSVEAWARHGRYDALARMARVQGASVVLLGHHRRDQAETFLLQALRGGGTAGLAGMPERVERDGIVWLRPWLRRSRDDIEAYLTHHRLDHIDDDSNGDRRFARNRLRLAVWPAFDAAFADAELALARAADWAREADQALAELAALDLDVVAADDGIDIGRWSVLSRARRSLALRTWLRHRTGSAVPAALTARLIDELPACRVGRWPVASGELRLHRGCLGYHPAAPTVAVPAEPSLSIRRAGSYPLPGWGGRLRARRVTAGGVPLAWLSQLELKARQGGERFQAGPGRPPRSLKKQFQQAGVAAWSRGGPLVYSGGLLVFVPGLGIDARVVGPPGVAAMALDWLPADAASWGVLHRR